MSSTWLTGLDPWHWWALGMCLVILELLSPGVFLLWIGMAAGLVGVLLIAFPTLPWEIQVTAFAIFSLLVIALQDIWLKHNPIQTDHPMLNRRGHQYVGRLFTLDDPINNGIGKIRVDDSTWKIRGDDCAAGTKIVVIGVDGTVLLVEQVRDKNDT